MKVSMLAGLLLLGGAGSVFAAKVGSPINDAPATFNWSGAFAGAHLGYGWGNSDFIDREYNGLSPFPVVNWGVHSDGVMGGIQTGYNWQHGNAVLGLEGEVGHLNFKGKKIQPGTDPFGIVYDAYGTVDKGWYGGISARLGYVVDRTLFYSKVGLVYSGAEVGFIDTCTTAPCGNGMIDATEKIQWAYQLGVGVEHVVANRWTIKAEYAYFDFGNMTITGTGVGGVSNGITYNIDTDLSVHTVRLGMNYKF